MLSDPADSILDRLSSDSKIVNTLLEKFGFEQALPADPSATGTEHMVRIVHVLLQLLNSKLRDQEHRKESESVQQKLHEEIRVLKGRNETSMSRLEQAERRADEAFQSAQAQQAAADQLRKQLSAKSHEIMKMQAQAAMQKKQSASAFRRQDADANQLREQLNEALRDGCVSRADAIFSRLPFSQPVSKAEEDGEGTLGRSEALNEENGELRALLAAVYIRLRERQPAGDWQIQDPQSAFEMPVSIVLPAIREDLEMCLNAV